MTDYKPHEPEVPPQAKDYKPDMNREQQLLWERDRVALDQAIFWLKNFWWTNRGSSISASEHAAWETDRAILALINLKNAPSYEENTDD
jgi:hypothetical protein